ncbi:hypothetical protein GCM10011519_29300 [Marmoricola endophyticus]|uniref:Carbon monoxide dehydrogenase n=1 Tax=Marmoricola endophyticus TaxID=2040280 RepID=A0A917BRB2_9ACTN|nr:carbon monoxide dehydrogenase subunit G [Marmoricola endophyticus]GGF53555.1 hypothetical protein GCM10011519_29300 [Marmoricola endophyticus]
MKISGSNTLAFPVGQVWDALLDPRVLVSTIPGCERLETTGENEYAMTVTAGVASIKGTYAGSCALQDLVERESLVMKLKGAGAPGTIDASVEVAFADLGEDGTRIDYQADATVGGMVGGVGQRMLTSVSKRMAAEFFGNVAGAIGAPQAAGAPEGAGAAPVATQPDAAAPATTFTPPAKRAAASSVGSSADFLKGVGTGAALVLVGVIVGSRVGRQR